MNWLQKISGDLFDDMLNTPRRQEVRKDPPDKRPITLTLYHGSKWKNLGDLVFQYGSAKLEPSMSEQGFIWFSEKRELAARYANPWLVTYQLPAARHYERVHYDDGSNLEFIPDQIIADTNKFENGKFWQGRELTEEGWFFSYKDEKPYICGIPLTIEPHMIEKIER